MKRQQDLSSYPCFAYRGRQFHCEAVSVAEVADQLGTPCYLYSRTALEAQFRDFDHAFSDLPHLTCYAVKANSNLAILSLFRRLGSGFDVVSGGEMRRAMRAGAKPGTMVFSGVGKTEDEIDLALHLGILQFNVESAAELKIIEARAAASGKTAPISLRVNPEVDPRTHPYIATALRESKFGVQIHEALALYRRVARSPRLRISGIAFHIGSQITSLEPFSEAVRRLRDMLADLRAAGLGVQYLDLGGGLGITYSDEKPPRPADYAGMVKALLGDLGCTLILEPGRVIVGNAGILVTRVLLAKKSRSRKFIVVDAAMNDLLRPSLYGAYHRILPLVRTPRPSVKADVVGPICESGDFIARDRTLPAARAGERLVVMSAGAYGFVLSSNYNSRPRAAEVLVCGDEYRVIRRRERFEDMVRGETARPFFS